MGKTKPDPSPRGGIFDGPGFFTRLCLNTPQLFAGMKGRVNRAEARQSRGGLAVAQFRFNTCSQLRGTKDFWFFSNLVGPPETYH